MEKPVYIIVRAGGKLVRIRISDDATAAATTATRQAGGDATLRGVEAAALQSAPPRDGRPVSIKQLARLASYKDTGHFREAVRVLIDRGLLVRVRGGICRAT